MAYSLLGAAVGRCDANDLIGGVDVPAKVDRGASSRTPTTIISSSAHFMRRVLLRAAIDTGAEVHGDLDGSTEMRS